jgi:hypothetical protein
MSNKARLLTGGVVGFAVAAVVAYFFGGSIFGPSETNTTAVVLAPDGGVCKASDPLALRVKSNHPVTWNITNNCTDPQFVQIRDFRERNQQTGTLGSVEVITNPDRPTTTSSIPSNGLGQVTATVTKSHGYSHQHYFYKYEIWIGTSSATLSRSRDPDVEEWDK